MSDINRIRVLTLRLDRVEERKLVRVQLFERFVSQRGHRKWLQVEEFRGRWILLRQNQVTEGDRKLSVTSDPAVGDDADEVLGRKWIEDGHEELDDMLLLAELLLQQEVLVMEDHFAVDVLHEDPERLKQTNIRRSTLDAGS